MNIEQYPEYGYFIMINGPITQLGSYEIQSEGDLALCHLRVYHRNPSAFNYQMRLVCSSKVGGPALAASAWETFSNETTGQETEFWMGDLTFTFTDYKLFSGIPYYFRFETQNYIRQDNDAYLGVWMDWGFGKSFIVPVGSTDTGGARLAIGVKR